MKNSMRLSVLGLVVALVLSAGAVLAAVTSTTTNAAPKSANVSTTATNVKLTRDDVTNVVLKVYKDAQITDIQLNKDIYTVKVQTVKGNRILSVGGNSGKILKNVANVAQAGHNASASDQKK